MAYYSKYTGAELEERLDKVEEIPQLIAQMITGKDFVTKEDLLCVLKDYAPADYRTIPIDNNTIYWENGVLKAATSDGTGQCQWELREHNGIQYLYSRLPVVTQYDVTMYADVNHLDLPSIYDGLPIDGDTIYWEITKDGRVLKAKSTGGSGGSGDIDASQVVSIITNAGFATQTWVRNALSDYVNITDYQEITGVKNFLNGLQIAGLPITKLNGYEDVIYIDANVVVRGGLTMYSTGEADIPSLTDSIVTDGITILNDNGVLKINPDIQLGGITEEEMQAIVNLINTKWTTDNTKISHWDTAYSWGNHANAGYVTKQYVDDTFVTFEKDEIITGLKTFTKGIQIGNSKIKINQLQDDVLYIDSNVVIRGGLTMYYEDGEIDLPTIKDEIGNAGYDGVTGLASFNSSQFFISNDGTVTIIGGSTGLDTAQLKDYLDSNKYTTETWVTNQKYITGISSAMVVSALGFTPYNSASFTKANIKSTLGISDWALASSKPSYNFSEIGTKPTTIAGYGITDAYTITQADALYAKYLPLTGGTLSGDLVLKSSSQSSDTPRIIFQRGTTSDNYYDSYIFNTGGSITFGISYNGGYYKILQVTNSGLRPVTNNNYVLGTDALRYSNIYSMLGNFSGEVSMQSANINGGKITYDATNKYWKLEGDLLVTGGVTMYGADGTDFETIYDGLPIDGTTIYWSNGVLKASSSGSTTKYPLSWSGFNQGSYDGSVAQSFYIPTKLSEFVNDKSFATTSDLSGYLPLSGGELSTFGFSVLTLKRKNNETNSGIALTFANNNSNEICSIFSKESTRYLYRTDTVKNYKIWDEGNDGSGSGLDADLLDGYHHTSFHKYHSYSLGAGKYLKLEFGDTVDCLISFNTTLGAGGSLMYYSSYGSGTISRTRFRYIYSGSFITAYVDNSVSSRILYIKNEGSEQRASIGVTFLRTGNSCSASVVDSLPSSYTEFNNEHRLATLSDNVASATKLQTARTIWGQSFDGSADVSGNLILPNNTKIKSKDTNTNERVLLNLDSNNSVIVGNNVNPLFVNGKHITLQYGANYTKGLTLNEVGNILIGTTTDNGYKLQVEGSMTLTRGIITGGSTNGAYIGSSYAALGDSYTGGTFYAYGANPLYFYTNNKSRMIVDANGNIGVGTPTNPAYKLDVNGTIHTNSSLWVDTIEIKKSQNDVLYIDGNLVVRGGVTMYAENEVDIPSIIESLPIANANTQDKASKGIASFDSTYFKVTDGWVTLTSAPSSVSTIGSLQDVSSSVSGTTNSDVVLFKSANSSTWTTKPLSEIGGGGGSVSGNYLPLSGGTINGKITVSGIGGWAIEQKKGDSYVFSLGSGSASTSEGTENGILQLYQNGSEVVRLYAASGENNWILNNLGIKTSNPSYTLDVNGTFHSNYAMISSNRIDPLHVNNSTSGASHSCMLFYTNDTLRSQFGYSGGGTYYYNYASGSYIKLLDEMEGNTRYIEVSDNIYIGTANRKNLLGLHPSFLVLGYSAMEANIPTYIDGAEIYLRYGANWSNAVHLKSDNSVQIPGVLYFGEHGKTNDTSTNIGYIGRGSTNNRMILYCKGETYIYSNEVLAVKLSSTNMLVYGGFTMYSDIRKKTKLQDVELSLSQIANAPLIQHYYNSDQDKTTHVGSIAQYWASLNDWFCKLDAEGFYTMEIQNAALASAISIARHLEKYETKTDKTIRKMKQRIQELEEQVERLKKD